MAEHGTIYHTRWYDPDIDTALAEPTTAAEEASVRPSGADKRKRGRSPIWDWDPIVAEAEVAYAQAGGKMEGKNLVALIMDLAERQTGQRPRSKSTAERLAAKIQIEWRCR
jgi:hypothetical protein